MRARLHSFPAPPGSLDCARSGAGLRPRNTGMIVFGCAITEPSIYVRCAQPGIERASEQDSEVVAIPSAGLDNPDGDFREHGLTGSIFRNYNLILDQVADRENM